MTMALKYIELTTKDNLLLQNNTYHKTLKMKPVNVRSGMYIDYGIKHNGKYPQFKIGDHVRISKYKNIFAYDYTRNWYEAVFLIRKVKLLLISTVKQFSGHFMKKKSHKESKIEKAIKRKDDTLSARWKGYLIHSIAGLIQNI